VSNQISAVPTTVESNDANPSNFIISRFNHTAVRVVKRAGITDGIGLNHYRQVI
jgi:hypothetical protein